MIKYFIEIQKVKFSVCEKAYYTSNLVILCLLIGCKLQQPATNVKLQQAVITGEAKAVQKYLKRGAFVNYQGNKRGWTPLLFAVEAGYSKIVSVLIAYDADVNMVSTKHQVSPLQRAAAKGDLDIIRLLINNGADLNHQDTQLRSTPLMWACLHGYQEAARLLLDSGALIDVRGNRGESALFLAVSAQQVDLVEVLISYQAKTDRPDIYGITPLQKAIELDNKDIINLLDQ